MLFTRIFGFQQEFPRALRRIVGVAALEILQPVGFISRCIGSGNNFPDFVLADELALVESFVSPVQATAGESGHAHAGGGQGHAHQDIKQVIFVERGI